MSQQELNSSLYNSMTCLSKRNKHLFHWLIGSLSMMTLYQWSASIILSIIVATLYLIYSFTGGSWYLYGYVVLMTIYRDAISLLRFLRINFFLFRMRRGNRSVPKIFQSICSSQPNKTLFHYQDEQWTFKQVDEFSNKIVNYFLAQGFQKGDEIALFMENRPEYVAIWLGLAKAGIVSALINNNQRMNPLIHSLVVIKCKALIFSSELFQAVDEIREDLKSKNDHMKFYCFNVNSNDDHDHHMMRQGKEVFCKNLNIEMDKMSSEAPQKSIDSVSFNDRLLYIYTSGTEGLPKAAIIKNSRFIYMGAATRFMINIKSDDILYTCLPLYHLAGGTIGACQGVVFGNTIAIRGKFSASNFWKDCIKYRCTVAQYIGEICRYLLSQPESPCDRQHTVRLMFGNGLRQKIWKDFVNRFNIKQIGELYGSTEGNANMINVDNKEGACGFISQIAPIIYPARLIRIDEDTGKPIRDKNGLCVCVKPGETGEFVGKITADPTRAFDGYANKEATKKKIIYDVFRKGDCAFASGDLLTMDLFGYIYFKDRCGDTFRWKGENISTTELEAVISDTIQLADCIVYGVEVPGCEGKAGMAAILDNDRTVDVNDLLKKLRQKVPIFSIPVFIRLVDQLELTSTHKLHKVTYRKQGFDPQLVKDPLYFFDSKNFTYIPLDQQLYNQIIENKIRI
ncbi:fatty acid transport protein 1 [Dermatophagoides farinae]|uniref:fatty acid transport protein 1 n=1 Tax=Dermatophagoides farinae TaxID=6954 RepID=UPI003F6445B8